MRRYTLLTILVLALAFGSVPAGQAQGPYLSGFVVTQAEPASVHLAAISGDIAAIVKYVGSETSATVAIAAGGDVTFEAGGAASTSFECPVSGALGGIMDVSDAACDTYGEFQDMINASSDWRMVLIDAQRADLTTNTMVTFAATEANGADGLQILNDGAVSFLTSLAVLPPEFRTSIKPYIVNRSGDLVPNPYDGLQTLLFQADFNTTYSSGTSTLSVESSEITNGTLGYETVTTLWSEAGGATTVLGSMDFTAVGGILGRKNEKLIARVTNSANQSVAVVSLWGVMFRY